MSELLQPYNERMMEVLLYIQRNLDGDLSPETLAEQACFSVVHFHRIFKGMIGESLKEHVRRLRLERSAYRLCYTESSVIDIALDAGFESPETFSRAFKKRFLISPSDFRNNSRAMLAPGGEGKINYHPNPSIAEFELDKTPHTCKVDIRIREETQVVFIRHLGPYFEVQIAWEKIRYDACFSVTEEVKTPPEMGMQIIPGGKFAVTTHYGSYEGIHAAYRELYGKWLPSSGYQLKNSVPTFEKYIKVPPEELRSEACVTIENEIDAPAEIKFKDFPGGKFAVTTHLGPYENLKETWTEFYEQWLPQSGETHAEAPCYEQYMNDPKSTKPEHLVTILLMPLK